MRFVFLGTPAVAVPSLTALIDAGHEPRLVVSQPDRPRGRSRDPVAPPVKQAAAARGLEIFQPQKVRNAAFRERLAAARPEVLVVVAYGRILPPKVLALAPHGAVNLHFSLLPLYRGAAPVQWTLANGETRTGVTTMMIDEGLDEGDVLLQQAVDIEPREHAPALAERLAQLGAGLLVATLRGLASGEITPRPQDHSRATLAPLLKREDGEMRPDRTAAEVEARIRGFDPWPGVWFRRRGKRMRIVDARRIEGSVESAPGTVRRTDSGELELICGSGTRLQLIGVQPEGSRVLNARDAVNGRHLEPGDRLEGPPS